MENTAYRSKCLFGMAHPTISGPDLQNVETLAPSVRRVWNKRLPGGLYLSSRAISVAVRTETKGQSPPESEGLNLVVIIEGNITEVHHKFRLSASRSSKCTIVTEGTLSLSPRLLKFGPFGQIL